MDKRLKVAANNFFVKAFDGFDSDWEHRNSNSESLAALMDQDISTSRL
jgi:hypothetical protein